MKKIILGLVALIVIAVVGAGGYLYVNGTKLIKQAVVEYGPQITGTPVGLEKVTLMPLTGKAGVSGVSIGTPKGYSAPYSFQANDISVKLQPKTLLDRVLVIDDVTIAAPSVIYEPKNKSSNIEQLQKNVEDYIGPDDGSSTAGPEKVIIKRLAILRPEIVVYAGGLIGKQSVTAKDIVFTDIGVKENGVPPEEVASIVMASLQTQVLASIKSKAGKQLLNSALNEAVKQGLPVDDVKDLLGGKNVDETVKKGLGGLLKKIK